MVEATMLALIAFAYAAFISFTSMAVMVFFRSHNLLSLGHIVVLTVFCGAGLGLVAWMKQKLGSPLVNVACSMASLAIITVLTKEEAVHAGNFSFAKIFQVLKMVLMGIVIATGVSLLIKPLSASTSLRDDLVQITDLLEEILTTITRSFLSGSEADLQAASYVQMSNKYKATFNTLIKNLRESKYEHYLLGTENEYKIETRLTKCIERLAQDLVGLRSAAATQFALISSPGHGVNTPTALRLDSITSSPSLSPDPTILSERISGLAPITEEPEESPMSGDADRNGFFGRSRKSSVAPTATAPADIFSLFIKELGPPMKSLAYTLKGVLSELPFEPGPEHRIPVNTHFRRSLVDAKDLFSDARREALELLYKNRALAKSWSAELAADYEEVAASCGHFSSSLQDFAEDTIAYLDILEELHEEIEWEPRKRSWNWLRFWRKIGKKKQTIKPDGKISS
jgi:hypothetical protein